jgi:hypothetical protein
LKARPGASSAVAPAFSSHLRAAAAIHAGGSAAVPPPMPCRSVASIAVAFLSSDRMTTLLPDLFDRAERTGRFAECRGLPRPSPHAPFLPYKGIRMTSKGAHAYH